LEQFYQPLPSQAADFIGLWPYADNCFPISYRHRIGARSRDAKTDAKSIPAVHELQHHTHPRKMSLSDKKPSPHPHPKHPPKTDIHMFKYILKPTPTHPKATPIRQHC